MYNDFSSRFATMGDVDVVWHDGVYHLFHLILPNHVFIAHAVSCDGINWERTDNALFIGNPGTWDDLMLWTMHVSADPHHAETWRMFYTGLSRSDGGAVQRIGIARSADLVHWTKVSEQDVERGSSKNLQRVPFHAEGPRYEAELPEDRAWVSFRDPFYFRDQERGFLIMAARAAEGASIRRGCVGIAEEVSADEFRLMPPLHRPGQYDDVEVPNILRLGEQYYLIGSIREDAKIRYWCSDGLGGPWVNYYDNVLLAEGNYAARVSWDDRGPLLWNFYTRDVLTRSERNLMPPPKRVTAIEDGRLVVNSFDGFDALHKADVTGTELTPLKPLLDNQHCSWEYHAERDVFRFCSDGGFEGFLFPPEVHCFRFRATLSMSGLGKCGLLVRIDPTTSDGYYLSLDLLKGVAQWRAWGHQSSLRPEQAFRFKQLQSNYWRAGPSPAVHIEVLAVGNYLEFSIDQRVLLSLADESYAVGRLGIYVESACVELKSAELEHLHTLSHPGDELANR